MLRTITGKVTLSLLVFLALLVGVALMSLFSSLRIDTTTRHLGVITLIQAELNEQFIYQLGRSTTELVSAVALGSEAELEEAYELLDEAKQVHRQFIALAVDETSPTFADLNRRRGLLIAALEESAADVAASFAAPEAGDLDTLLEGLEESEEEIELLRADQRAFQQASAAADVATVAAGTRIFQVMIPAQFIAIGLVSGLAVWLLHRFVVRPVRELAKIAPAIGAGQLDQPVPSGGMDEVGILQGAIRQMVVSLRHRDQLVAERTQEVQSAMATLEGRTVEQARLLAELAEQRDVVRSLSVPVLPVGRQLLAIPLVGALDAERLELVRDQTISAIERTRARIVLLDVTGVPVVDDEVAAGLLTIMRAARLLGARIELAGIRPEVAQTLVGLGATLEGLPCHGTLERGLELAFRSPGAGNPLWEGTPG